VGADFGQVQMVVSVGKHVILIVLVQLMLYIPTTIKHFFILYQETLLIAMMVA
jgi:hypothetical protein